MGEVFDFCTYISERVLSHISKIRGGSNRKCTIPQDRSLSSSSRCGKHPPEAAAQVIGLSAACILLCAALMQTAGTVVGPGQTAAWGVFGAMLLREDAGGYVLVAVLSLRRGGGDHRAVLPAQKQRNPEKGGADKHARHEQEEKSQ